MTGAAGGRGTHVDVPYRLNWRTSGVRAGAHRGKIEGSGGLFRDFDLLTRSPDPRRIDLRMSLRDPFGALYVRRFEQMSSITVYVLVDVSGSMGFKGQTSKMQVVADFCATLAASARRIGDSFGLIGCAREIVPELFFPATRSRGGEAEMIESLRRYQPTSRGAEGLLEAASYLAGRRKLVFVLSDFLWPQAQIDDVFEALSQHDVVPILLRDERESESLPRYGLVTLRDLETGQHRLVLVRPSLRAAWQAKAKQRRQMLEAVATRSGRAPFMVVGNIDWERVGAYLMGEAV